ncbi:MAG: NfeD family protein [candidate division WOR-3 bacterium]
MPRLSPAVWIIAGLVIAALEMVVPGFVVIWFGVAAIVTGILALFVRNTYFQLGFFAVLSGLLVFLAQWIGRRITRPEPEPAGANRMPGAFGTVLQDIVPGEVGRVKVTGEEWRAEAGVAISRGKRVRVVRVEGTRLIVEPADEKE